MEWFIGLMCLIGLCAIVSGGADDVDSDEIGQ